MLGPNGGGKTTLLKLIMGLISPKSGTVLVKEAPPKEMCCSIGYVPQTLFFDSLFPLTVLECVLMGELSKLTWYGKLNSKYGPRWGRMHKGLDLYLRTGDTVVAAFNGVVRYAQFNSGGYGNCVVVRHTNGLETIYGHLSKINVSVNNFVHQEDENQGS